MFTIMTKVWSARDPHPFLRNGTWTITMASFLVLHKLVIMAIYPVATKATCLLALFKVLHIIYPEDGIWYVSSFMLFSVILSCIGVRFRFGWIRLALFLPLLLVLAVMAWGGLAATVDGQYLDGTSIPWPHIDVDQDAYWAICAMFAGAAIRRCWDPNG